MEIKSEANLTFVEAASIIIGHGVGAGILSVPFIASRNLRSPNGKGGFIGKPEFHVSACDACVLCLHVFGP